MPGESGRTLFILVYVCRKQAWEVYLRNIKRGSVFSTMKTWLLFKNKEHTCFDNFGHKSSTAIFFLASNSILIIFFSSIISFSLLCDHLTSQKKKVYQCYQLFQLPLQFFYWLAAATTVLRLLGVSFMLYCLFYFIAK